MTSSQAVHSVSEKLWAPEVEVSHEKGNMASRPPTQGPVREEWDRHRATIKQLYLDEDKPLKEVMSVMANTYGLQGSLKMYKSRITKWRLDKKNKEREMAAVLRKMKERDAVGKATSLRIRGRSVDVEEVFRYWRRKGTGFPLPSPHPPTPSDIVCWTPTSDPSGQTTTPSPSPSPSPEEMRENSSSFPDGQLGSQFATQLKGGGAGDGSEMILHHPPTEDFSPWEMWDFISSHQPSPKIPQLLAPPQDLRIPEELFINIRSYFRRCMGTETWITNDLGQLINSQANVSVQINPGDIVAQCSNAAGLFKTASFVEGRRAMSKVFALIQNLLTAEGPSTLESFLASLLYLTKLGLHDIAFMLRRYIAQMAVRVLPNHDPWRQVCCFIGFLDADDFQLLLAQAYQSAVDAFEHELGPFHARTIACRVEFIHSLNTPNDLPSAEKRLRKLLSECNEFCGPSDWRSQYVMVSLSWNLNHQGRFAEAEAVGNYALQHRLDSDDSTTVIRRLELIGDSQYRQGKAVAAERNIRETINVIAKTRGRSDPWAVENIIRLEGWLREWGRDDEAAQLKVEIIDLLGSDDLT